MKRMKNNKTRRSGFTLVELLTTLAVVAVLIGLLVPALSMVQKTAMNVKQKGQFHAIETGLEAFRSDMGDYPASYAPYPVNNVAANAPFYDYYGAERLAEAMVGLDGFGFHPDSLFRNDGQADMDSDGVIAEEVYHANTDYPYETAAANRAARRGPYLELENANAVRLNAYDPSWYNSLISGTANVTPYVLADMFKIVQHQQTGKQIGMPILYYRANTSNFWHTSDQAANRMVAVTPNVYMQTDNYGFYVNPANVHPLRVNTAGYEWFYSRTANPDFPGPDPVNQPEMRRPYRAQSFILHSAGNDGLYGTEDDIFNFEERAR